MVAVPDGQSYWRIARRPPLSTVWDPDDQSLMTVHVDTYWDCGWRRRIGNELVEIWTVDGVQWCEYRGGDDADVAEDSG